MTKPIGYIGKASLALMQSGQSAACVLTVEPPKVESVAVYAPAQTQPVEAQTQEQVVALRAALEWYGEQARLARLIHSEGDKGRHALADDGGKRARAALATASEVEG